MDYLKMIADEEERFLPLFSRQDADKDLLIQKDFTLFDKDDREAPDVENLTLNDASVFAKYVRSRLVKAGLQIEVEGKGLTDEEASKYEGFFKDYLSCADRGLNERNKPDLFLFSVGQMAFRGRAGTRIVLDMKDDILETGLLPLDMRSVVYAIGPNRLKWIAPKFRRSKEDILSEYGVEIRDAYAILTDLWIDEDERVFIEKEELPVRKHGFAELPFVIQICPSGLFFEDGDCTEYQGESIFESVRKLYKSKNKMASILDTLNMGSIFGGLQKEVEDEGTARKPARPPYGKRFVVPIQKGTRGYFPMPITDIRMATRLLYSVLDSCIQDASVPRVAYGTLQAPLSGVGIAQLKEAEEPVFLPVIKGLSLYYQRILNMVLAQFKELKVHCKLGEGGCENEYSWSDFTKPVRIECDIKLTSAKEDMANISVAAAVGGLVSRDTKQRRYLHLENPDEENDKILSELASQVSPAIAKFDIARALASRGETIKARLMAEEMNLTLDQLLGGSLEKEPEIKPEEPKQLMPMFGGSQGGMTPSTESVEE